MAPLTNPAVNANALESSAMKLMQEFLARYFDGGVHAVGATPAVPFPAAELLFQQSAASQPLGAAGQSGEGRAQSGGLSLRGTRTWTMPLKVVSFCWGRMAWV